MQTSNIDVQAPIQASNVDVQEGMHVAGYQNSWCRIPIKVKYKTIIAVMVAPEKASCQPPLTLSTNVGSAKNNYRIEGKAGGVPCIKEGWAAGN